MSVQVTRLPSGLHVVTDAMPHLATASLGIWVAAGGRHERPSEHGLSHFLEHMAFKGTRRRSAKDIAEALEIVGGDLNAGTSTETTAYYARVLAADVPLAIDVLSDILTEPTFAAEEIVREQNVIVQEIGACEDTPDDIVFEHLISTAYPGQPLGRSILGTRQTVRSFDERALRSYLAHHYNAPNMVVVGTGAVDHDRVVAEVEARLANLPTAAPSKVEPARFGQGVKIDPRDLEQVHLACAFEGVCYTDPSIHSLQVFTNILGGGMSSRLFQEVRELRGLCYSIYAFHWPFAETGLFGIYAGTDEADCGELMRVALDQVAETAANLTEHEVARAKAQMKAGLLMALESSGARAEQLARQMMVHGRPIPLAEIVGKIDAVTVASTRAAGQALLSRGKTVLAGVGPQSGLESAIGIVESLPRQAA